MKVLPKLWQISAVNSYKKKDYMKIGTSLYGKKTFKKKNHYKQQDGDMVFRILPAMGKLAEKGRWSSWHSVHFGYKNLEGKFRPFESPLVKNNKSKMIEVPDAAMERLDHLKAQLLKAKDEGNAPLTAKLNTLVGQKGVYNIDNNHHMNVIDLQGNIGEFKIRHKCKVALDIEIAKLNKEGCDPLSVENGRFFVFNRTGTGNETNFKVSVYKEKIEVAGHGKVEKDVVHVLTQDVLARLDEEAFELDDLFVLPTSEEVAQIVAESELLTGKSAACNRIFDDRWKARRDQKAMENLEDGPDEPTDVAALQTVVTANSPKADSPNLLVASNSVSATVSAEVPQAPTAAVTVATQGAPTAISEMSGADLLAFLDIKQ